MSATIKIKTIQSVKKQFSALPVKSIQVYPAQAYGKMPRKGSYRRQLVDLLKKGCTLNQVESIIPASNQSSATTFMTKAVRCGFGIEQRGSKFFLINPSELDYA